MDILHSKVALLLVSSLALALVIFGWFQHPQISGLSVAAALLVVVLYAWIALRLGSGLLSLTCAAARFTLWGGIAGGVVFAVEIILEYVLLPADNSRFGLVEFGTVWLIYASVAMGIAAKGESLRSAIVGAAIAAMISSGIWCACLLGVFYAFEGTARQVTVLLAEGDFDDFRRSGMSSFSNFIVEDLFGATFFHLLLGPAIAAILAAMSWSGIAVARRFGPTL